MLNSSIDSFSPALPMPKGPIKLMAMCMEVDARLVLARRAERSLDVQYHHVANDRIGLESCARHSGETR